LLAILEIRHLVAHIKAVDKEDLISGRGTRAAPTAGRTYRIKSPFLGSWILLALADIWHLVVQIKRMEKHDLIPS